ncbi:hypothetical protein [Cellulosimicrobium sp. TH-20]|uniref:hypothetical protein n=1 Tax=Cellulosimicrobium sp. TH-20 TaxID=1980001 RepID=UPI0011A34494|nr:hypothetical protein [Cellulosimicrobium sp. TH-20]
MGLLGRLLGKRKPRRMFWAGVSVTHDGEERWILPERGFRTAAEAEEYIRPALPEGSDASDEVMWWDDRGVYVGGWSHAWR